jgi:hypothetical protein
MCIELHTTISIGSVSDSLPHSIKCGGPRPQPLGAVARPRLIKPLVQPERPRRNARVAQHSTLSSAHGSCDGAKPGAMGPCESRMCTARHGTARLGLSLRIRADALRSAAPHIGNADGSARAHCVRSGHSGPAGL